MELSGLIGIEEEKMKSAAENAINYFEILVDTAGNWDTFIPKYVQVTMHFICQFFPVPVSNFSVSFRDAYITARIQR